MTAFHLLSNHLRRHPFASLFVILLIAATTALSVAINLQERALREGSARAANTFDLLVGAPGSETQLVLSAVFLQPGSLTLLTPAQLRDIEVNPLVAWSSPVGFGDFYQGHPIVGVNHELLTLGGTRQVAEGRFFTRHNEAVAGARSGLHIGDSITPMHGSIGEPDAHTHENFSYTVVGILPDNGSVWDEAILVPIESVWLIHGSHKKNAHHHVHQAGDKPHDDKHGAWLIHGGRVYTQAQQNPVNQDIWHAAIDKTARGGAPAVVVKPKSIAGAYQLRSQYRGNGTQAVFPGEVLVKLYTTLGDAKKLLTVIAVVTQILVALAVALIITLYLNQQKRHIAALRAFGAPRGKIFLLIWAGMWFMIAVAVILGAVIGYVIARIASVTITAQNGFILPVHFTGEDFKLLALLFIIAIVSLLIPSLRHYRIPLADTLRHF